MIALGALFITAEYRRGMIRTTFAASPRRGRVLAAKAIVIGLVTFAAGLAGAAVALPIAENKLHSGGWASSVYPVWSLTSCRGLQIVVGTAGLLAAAAILALSAGAVLRRSAGAIAAVVVLLIVPLILGVRPAAGTRGLGAAAHPGRRVRGAAGHTALLAGDQRLSADQRLFPAGTVGGFAVLCVWAAVALGSPCSCCAGGTHERADAMNTDRPRTRPCGRPCMRSGPSCARCRAPAGCCSPRSR